MKTEYKVTFIRYDESGRPFTQRVEGYFELEDDKILNVSSGLDDILSRGDSLADIKRKLKPPYFKVERASESDLH